MLPNVSAPSEYGLPKTNYDSNGVVDPETELDAPEYERIAVDVAAMSHVSPRAIVVCTVAGGVVTIAAYRSVWGDEPAVWPVATYNGAGDYTLTWAAGGYADLNPTVTRRVTRAPNFIAADVVVNDSTGVLARTARVHTVAANSARVLVFDAAEAAIDVGFTIWVY